MPPPYPTFDDDDQTTDSNTVMTKEYEAHKVALRLRKDEVDRQLKALEISASTGNGGGKGNGKGSGAGGGGGSAGGSGNASVDSKELGDSNKASTQHQQHGPYLPPVPPPHVYFGGGVPGYPPYPTLPLPTRNMYPGGPSAIPGGSTGSERDGASNGPVHQPPPPFNPYDPHYYAAVAAAHLHQQGTLPFPPPHASDPSQDNYLVKLLQEKEEELKSVRKTLEETQTKLQDQTLQAARLQVTLDQVQASFKQERQLIQLQAEKRAQDQFQAQQQEIFQKQLDLMDRWQSGVGVGGGGISVASASTVPYIHPPPVLDEPPSSEAPSKSADPTASNDEYNKPDSVTSSTGTTENGKSDKKYTWKNQSGAAAETKAAVVVSAAAVAAATTTTADQKTEKQNIEDGVGGISNEPMQNPMDDSLYDSEGMLQRSNHSDPDVVDYEEDEKKDIIVTTPLAEAPQLDNEINDSARQAPGTKNVEEKQQQQHQQASDRFIPKYIEQSNADVEAAEYAQYKINNSPDDDVTLGQTVASSTYGEDRVKVVNQSLLDPYGDKGTYTGIILRSTGMPHDLGRMIYEEDGRIYEGDWSVFLSFGHADFSRNSTGFIHSSLLFFWSGGLHNPFCIWQETWSLAWVRSCLLFEWRFV